MASLAEQGVHVGHYDMRFVKPLDIVLLDDIATRYNSIVTVEDGCIQGGFGCAVLEALQGSFDGKIIRLGIPDGFVKHGPVQQLISDCGYDADAIVRTVNSLL